MDLMGIIPSRPWYRRPVLMTVLVLVIAAAAGLAYLALT
jgi:hypothetical protein